MAKTPRPSIADQLANIASTSPRDSVITLKRESVTKSEVGSPTSEIAAVSEPPAPVQPQEDVVTLPRGILSSRRRGVETADGLRVRQRVEKPHASLYAHPRVFKKLREIAAAEDCKPHDLYVEGLRMVLARYGFDLDKLERGDT